MSDIRKIQTGNNQYTLHARVSDKLAIMCSSKTRNNTNYPFHRILKTDVYSNNTWENHGITLYLSGHYASPSARFGIIDIEFSQNGDGNSAAKITWIVRSGFEIDDVQAGLYAPASGTYIDVYLKTRTAYDGVAVKCISEGDWAVDNQTYKFVNSEEVNNTTASNKLTSYEVYKTIEEAATQLHGKAYTSIIKPTDSGTVANAGYAEKIGMNKSHPQIGSPTKPVYVDNSGQVRACSRDIPTGMTIDSVLNDTSVNAVQNKVINAALKGKNPKAKADFIASSDLTALPITAGVLDLNGYTLTLSGTTELTGTLTIKNGTIGGNGIISSKDAFLYIYDCQLSDSAKISISCIIFVTDNLYYSHVLNEEIYITMPTLSLNNKTIAWISNSSCIRIEGQLTSASICDFGVSSIINSTYILIQNIAINIKTSNNIFLSGAICTHIDSCSDIGCIPDDEPEFGINGIDQNSIVEISNCIFDNGTNTSLIMEGWYDTRNHRYLRFGYVDNMETYYNSNFYGLPTSKAVLDYLKNYVKKDDISKVYKYKGTKTNYSELPTSGNDIGDVWNITNADIANHIKAGDNVVWDGSKWDNLSGTVDLSNYLQKGGNQTTTSTADGGSNVYTFKDGSTITVKNGSKGSTGAAATWFSGGAVTGTSTTAKTFTVSGSKAGDMYLNTGTSNVYKATAANQWVYLCNIKGPQGTPGNNGTTPTIKAAAGDNIGAVGTPSVTANTSGTTTTFTFNNLKGQKGDTGATVTWHTGTAVTGTAATVAGAKTGDMYLNTKTYNVYKSTGINKWTGVCNIKGANGTTPTIKAAAGGNINSVGTPTVSATTSDATTTFTFNNLKGQKGDTGATITWHSGTDVPNAGVHAVTNAKVGDMYLNTHTCDVFKAANAVQSSFNWVFVCNIKGTKGDAADIPKLTKGVAGIVPGTTNDNLNAFRWLNGGDNGTGKWSPLPIAGGGTTGIVRTCKDYTGSINKDDIHGYGHGTTPPTLQPITSGASDYRGVESDGSGRLFVNVPAYEKNINRAQNTVLAAPTTGTGTATFRKLTTSDIPWDDKLKVVTESQFNSTTPRAGVFYFVLEE